MFASVWVRSARNRPSSSRASSIFVTWSRPCASETKASDRDRGPLDRAADRLGGEGDEGLLGVVEDLRAEAAADVRGDDPQLVLGDAEHEGAHQQPDDVRVLRGGPERVLVVAGVVLADRGPRLHGVRHQPVVDELERRDVWRGCGSPRRSRRRCRRGSPSRSRGWCRRRRGPAPPRCRGRRACRRPRAAPRCRARSPRRRRAPRPASRRPPRRPDRRRGGPCPRRGSGASAPSSAGRCGR